ncbi:hypothetical protein NLG97_g7635 [Lecanicillium saksenae]|uniref:Uncharacterized protein n=1 Tax=Lecanicillium saksenae TaxID=468837 RepID=A0ACC1QNK2_9HYPO|nr:hypothetical protein NLG97_g7635 [Lecanicillium saksenae]
MAASPATRAIPISQLTFYVNKSRTWLQHPFSAPGNTQLTTLGMSVLSFPTTQEPVSPDAVQTSTSDPSLLEAQRYIDDLKRRIECEEAANEELGRQLLAKHEKLEEEVLQRKMLEFDLNQHKEVIAENVVALRQRDETIELQGWLLRTSWLGCQAAASSQRQAIHVLQEKIDELSTKDRLLPHNNNKRKFSEYGEPTGSPVQQLTTSCTTQFGQQHTIIMWRRNEDDLVWSCVYGHPLGYVGIQAKLEHQTDLFGRLCWQMRGKKRLSDLKLLGDVHNLLISSDTISRN